MSLLNNAEQIHSVDERETILNRSVTTFLNEKLSNPHRKLFRGVVNIISGVAKGPGIQNCSKGYTIFIYYYYYYYYLLKLQMGC
jgi:hypothetical protein